MKKIFWGVMFFSLFLSFNQVQAAGLVPCGGPGQEACTFCHLFQLINTIIREMFFWVVPTVATLMLVVGGVLFLFGGAKASTLQQAKGIITSVVIGLLIIFAAWIIVNTVLTQSGVVSSPSILRWYEVSCQAP